MDYERIRYERIINDLKIINRQIEELNKDILNLKKYIKQSISIDDKGFDEEIIDDISNELVGSYNIIRNNIIPSLNRNKYS